MSDAATPVVYSPVGIDWKEEVKKMAEEEKAFLGQDTKLSVPFGSVRQRLEAGEITEEQLVDMLEARGISLLEANEMTDAKLVIALTLAGTTVPFPAFEMVLRSSWQAFKDMVGW